MNLPLLSSLQKSSRWKYLARSACHSLQADRRVCPNCGCAGFDLIKRKYVVTALVRCRECRVLYRMPTDPPQLNAEFYQEAYSSGFTTDCPDESTLARLKQTRFQGTPKDFAERIALLQALGVDRGQRVLDFGASWGYGTWQLSQAGLNVAGFEISRPRAQYAREMLGLNVVDPLENVPGPFDVVFTCHVLEHVPRPAEVFEWLPRVLKPGGLLVAITTNGSMECMKTNPTRYHRGWGGIHPFYLDVEFYRAAFGSRPRLLASVPYDLAAIRQWDHVNTREFDLSGWELLCAVVL